ncbi:relaxase/mobilization nuclease domain-containing protein [Achromobacter sp. 413638]|uniref:relaxase/mobilization nuclease domain-containing protein n=1 Tax=Achromobacter sp. 413638 TaxID=3342385 RepID=UPI00370A1A54
MIIKLFRDYKAGRSSAKGAVNYCLSDFDSRRNRREVKPVVVKGDPYRTRSLDSLCPEKWTSLSTSGAIAFRDKEEITQEKKLELIDQFERTFLGNMRDRTNILWIEHRDKGNLELHFVINKIDLVTGKYFNPFPPGHIPKKDAFVKLKNDELGFEQVEQKNPFKTFFTDDERKALLSSSHNFKSLDKKAQIDKVVKNLIVSKKVKNQDELIKWFKDNGFKLSRTTEKSISIEIDGGRNIRLKGGMYESSNLSYQEIFKEFKEKKEPFDKNKYLSILATEIDKSNKDNEKRFFKANTEKATFQNRSQAKNQEGQGVRATPQQKIAQNGSNQVAPKADQVEHQAQPPTPSDTAKKPVNQGSSSPSTDNSHTDKGDSSTPTISTGGIDGAMAEVQQLTAKIANAKTLQEKIRLEFELAKAMAKLQAEKDKQLNQGAKTKWKI